MSSSSGDGRILSQFHYKENASTFLNSDFIKLLDP